jgi:hypothetical protein
VETKTQFIERLSWLLDESITLPNGYKIGLDGFIGLIPGVGDFIGGSLSSIIIYKAHQLGVPRMILGRMIINMMIETVLGAIPVAGDVFDFVWKANKRNVALLKDYQQQPKQVYRKSLMQSILFIAVLLGILVLTIALIAWIIGLLVAAISN